MCTLQLILIITKILQSVSVMKLNAVTEEKRQDLQLHTSTCIFHYHEDLITRVNHFIQTHC